MNQNEITSADPVEDAVGTPPQVMESSYRSRSSNRSWLVAIAIAKNPSIFFQLIMICLLTAVPAWIARLPRKNIREPNVLPISSNDLTNTSLQANGLTWKAFFCFVAAGMLDISPYLHGALLFICCSYLILPTKSSTNPFDFLFGKTTTIQSVISFQDAFFYHFRAIADITKFVLCYILTWMLVLPLPSGFLLLSVLLLICSAMFYFPELVHQASVTGVYVACGSFKLSLIWFVTLGAVGLAVFCVLVTLLISYMVWRFLYKGKKTSFGEVGTSLNGVVNILSQAGSS